VAGIGNDSDRGEPGWQKSVPLDIAVEINWKVDPSEKEQLRAFVTAQSSNVFVRNRYSKNVINPPVSVTLEDFWQSLVGCLLTSRQRSGPDSHVSRFLLTEPFPLSYQFFQLQRNPESAASHVLKEFGGIRFTSRIPQFLAKNYLAIQRGLWQSTNRVLQQTIDQRKPQAERKAAEFIRRNYKGFGPKQSRNLLQDLGLTMHEIPIDSRITKWLNGFGFPVALSATALTDPDYYNFVSDGIQEICRQSGILPCVLDAAIFSSYDGDGWTEENVLW
jgi:thermostable 8-oxoguanine DNA glycosylase